MSTQKYYKNRLGFDPNEVVLDGLQNDFYGVGNSKPSNGYEENINKFKGTIWDFFIEAKGTVEGY